MSEGFVLGNETDQSRQVAAPAHDGPETSACIIATYGPAVEFWNQWAEKAVRSAFEQTVPFDVVLRVHTQGGTLAQARNGGGAAVLTDWLCFLDADDSLGNGYNEAMMKASGDIRWPAVSYDGGFVHLLDDSNFYVANHIVVGAFIRRSDFLRVGGFHEMENLEDWDLWKRMVSLGSTRQAVPDAVYNITTRAGSRNFGNWGNP